MIKPTISIVIPTYNRASLIEDAVNSVKSQDYNNWELIIVDDGSTDDTEKIIKPYLIDDKVIYVQRPASMPKGANACRNYGLALAKGEYVKWLDSDDILVSSCLSKQLETIKKGRNNVILCQAEFFTQTGDGEIKRTSKWGNLEKTGNITQDLVLGKIQWQTAAGLWEKEVLPKNPFNMDLQNSQEWLFHIEMSLLPHIKFTFLHETLCLIRRQETSMSHENNKNGRYYYFSSLARAVAINKLSRNKISVKARYFLLKKFFWYQLFSLYKGDPSGFLKLIFLSPKTIMNTFN